MSLTVPRVVLDVLKCSWFVFSHHVWHTSPYSNSPSCLSSFDLGTSCRAQKALSTFNELYKFRIVVLPGLISANFPTHIRAAKQKESNSSNKTLNIVITIGSVKSVQSQSNLQKLQKNKHPQIVFRKTWFYICFQGALIAAARNVDEDQTVSAVLNSIYNEYKACQCSTAQQG